MASKEFVNNFADFGIDISGEKPNDKGEILVLCPVCSHLRKPVNQKIKVLGVNVKEGVFGCLHCLWSGHLLTSDYARKKTAYKLPDKEDKYSDAEKFIQFFSKRSISAKTLAECKVGFTTTSIKQNKNADPVLIGSFQNKGCIVYNYYRESILTHVKYRDNYKNFKSTKDTELIFYGLDDIRGCKTCYIVEGENDKLAYWEAGIRNVVSVPNGAHISQKEKEHFELTGKLIIEHHQNLEYLDNCFEDFKDKEIIYIATDDDAAGIKLREELGRRLGYDRCKIVKFKEYEVKDANELLIKSGPEILQNSYKNASTFPIEDVIQLYDVWDVMEQQFDKGKIKGLSTGWKEIDPHFTWRFGEPTLLNGYFNNGKTTFEYNLMLGAAILYDWKFGAFMPENYPVNEAYDSLCEIYIGKTSDIEKHDRMNKQEYKDAAKFVHNHIKLISNNKRFSPADIRSISKQMIMQYGIVGIFTDPWKALKHHMGNKSIDLYLEDELQEEIDFALKHKCIKVIATHPPTPIRNKEKEYPAPSAFEVKGGEVWASMIYNQMCIHIPQDRSFEDTTTELHIQKIKNQKLVGIPTRRDNPILLKFDRKSGRYTDTLGTSPFDALDRQEKIKFEQPYYDF